MALRISLYIFIGTLLLAGIQYFTWNLVLTKLPITGIKIEDITFSLSLQLSAVIVLIQLIGKFGIAILDKIFD